MAIILGIGGAFASKAAQTKPAGEQWYTFSGTQAQINDLSKYTLTPNDPECGDGTVRCAVLAKPNPTNPNKPDLSQISQEELHN